MSIRLIASLATAAFMANADSSAEYGNFVYQSNGAKMFVNVTKDGMARFTIDCGRPYESDWFRMQRPQDDHDNLYPDIIHEFPSGSYEHRKLIHYSKYLCPQFNIVEGDFNSFYIDSEGNLETEFEDDYVILKREWLAWRQGRYTSSSESDLDMQLDVLASGSVYVRLGCKALPARPADGPYPGEPATPAGTTGYKLFRLVKKGNHYELGTYPGRRDSVRELADTFERVCPVWKNSYDFEEDFKTLKFATPDILYAFGDYFTDRLFRHTR
ncbi:hypothetical protein FOZ62_001092 [Perkinsus olseni]|uniref:Uncharacterized protein n=1 Tax=Perkinsus olseni TaxID=32597 RepID=A0A7J6QPN1_PEROL|nr:hypothetical protein FOZ62_001092 [Perkinsus olseni]